MGTNFYHRKNICEHCGRYDQDHIGKSSAGWTFSFHGEREENVDLNPLGGVVASFADWLDRLRTGGKIFDEYGREVSVNDFCDMVKRKSDANNNHVDYMRANRHQHPYYDCSRDWKDSEGHSFSEGVFS